MSSRYDVAVIGLGGVGAATLWRLAARGVRAVGVDRLAPPHDRGSSHGQSRIIRRAYFEHPDYVPLVEHAYRLWSELEQAVGQPLLRPTGLLQVGPESGVVLTGVREAARRHGLTIESLSAAATRGRWPQVTVPDSLAAAYEPGAGLLYVERCVAACLHAARACGAEIVGLREVRGWSAAADAVHIDVDGESLHADRVVVTVGPWAGDFLASTGVAWQVRRKVQLWYAATDWRLSADAGMPCFLFELPHGVSYGFPVLDGRGLKAAEHSGGEEVRDPAGVEREVRLADAARTSDFLRRHLPTVGSEIQASSICLYTMSPDEHFVVDLFPGDRRIAYAAGLSGHGFKFAPALGAALADLALDGGTTLPIGFLSAARFTQAG